MIKLNPTRSTNVKVLDETQLEQVVGGHHGGRRRSNYNYGHCYKHRHNSDSYGFDSGHDRKGYGEDGPSGDSSYGEGESY